MKENRIPRVAARLLLLIMAVWLPVNGLAQPSGGPYGPVDRTYEVPDAGQVYYVAPGGDPDAPGTSLDAPTTLEAAIGRVVTGDAIVLRGGIYRTGGLLLNQGITIQPYGDERPVLKGTRVATEWEALPEHVWRTSWDRLYPAAPLGWWRRHREGMHTPLHRFNNDMVFVDGKPLLSAGWEGELDAGSYYIDYDGGYVYIGVDPADRTVEITAHDSALVRTSRDVHGKSNDHKGPVIRGLTITQYAYRCLEVEGKKQFTMHDEPTDEPVGLADPSTFGKEVVGTVLENLTISYCSRVAGYFRGDGLIIRNTLVSDTGTEGIYVIGSSDVLLEKNIIRRNNIEHLTGYYASAVKIFNQTRRVVFRDNYITDHPDSNGVWYDVGNRDGVIVNNWIEGTQDGFFFEISDGATVAGNLFIGNHKGVRVLNSANVAVYNNTFVNNPASFERDGRGDSTDHFGWHVTTGPGVEEREGHVFVNNLLVAEPGFRRPLLHFGQPADYCERLSGPMAKMVDGNVYVRASEAGGAMPWPLVRVSPVNNARCFRDFGSLDSLRNWSQAFEAHGQQLDQTLRTVFKGPDVGHFELREPIRTAPEVTIPGAVRDLLGWSEEDAQSAGAFPAEQ